jgi:LPS-assembly protein
MESSRRSGKGRPLSRNRRSRLMCGLHGARGSLGKLGLLAGTALAILFATSATAQTATELPVRSALTAAPVLPSDRRREPHPAAQPAPVVDDALGQHGFYLEADSVIRDDRNNLWTARGGVEARYQGHVLRGDEVIYNVGSGAVTVNGHAQIINPDGTAEFADHIVLDDQMRAGFARGFSARLPDNVKFAADVAIRRSETVNELRRAVYTPCEVCTAKGAAKTPSWSIQASDVVEDRQRHLIFYRNAIIQVKGIPVFYTPVLWHPDPEAGRTSGLLLPRLEVSEKRGFSYEQAYYQVLSPSEDLYISPQLNTKVNPFINAEWRARFYTGEVDVRGGYTYEKDFNSYGDKFGDETSRSYILADGLFHFDDNWSWGFSTQRASDPYIFTKYDIANVFASNGLISNSTRQLLSQVYVTQQRSDSYLSVAALSFQGVTGATVDPTFTVESGRSLPWIAPMVEWRYDPTQDVLGGRLRVDASGEVLGRDQLPAEPAIPLPDTPGQSLNTSRATADANWRRSFTLANGMRLEPFADVRGDLYDASTPESTSEATHVIGRSLATAGLDFTWPFYRQINGAAVVLEPIAQLALSPDIKTNPAIPNEDSVVSTFDETNLFDANKVVGYDLEDSGQRLNLGGRATVDWGGGQVAHLLLGRTLRAQTTDVYAPNTGLDGRASDWVLAADAVPFGGLALFSRALINDDAQAERTEAGVNFAYSFMRGYFRYLSDNTQVDGRTSDIDGAGEFFVTRHWGFSAVAVRDLRLGAWRQQELGVIYSDECIRVQVVYQHKDTIVGAIQASNSVFLRLTLATLGDQGNKNENFR